MLTLQAILRISADFVVAPHWLGNSEAPKNCVPRSTGEAPLLVREKKKNHLPSAECEPVLTPDRRPGFKTGDEDVRYNFHFTQQLPDRLSLEQPYCCLSYSKLCGNLGGTAFQLCIGDILMFWTICSQIEEG